MIGKEENRTGFAAFLAPANGEGCRWKIRPMPSNRLRRLPRPAPHPPEQGLQLFGKEIFDTEVTPLCGHLRSDKPQTADS